MTDTPLPQAYLLKVTVGHETHYVFCEPAASFKADEVEAWGNTFSGILADVEAYQRNAGVHIDWSQVVPPTDGRCGPMGFFSAKMQTGKIQTTMLKMQSGRISIGSVEIGSMNVDGEPDDDR